MGAFKLKGRHFVRLYMEWAPSGAEKCRGKAQRAAPPLGGTARWVVLLEVNYLRARINFCSAWICLLIDAINATIDFRTSAFVTVAVPDATLYLAV